MGRPAVSVVLPVRNRADVVGEALTSVLRQSFTDLEVIVVDDGSTDGSAEAARRVSDDRVRVLHCPATGSAAGARNVGIAEVRGRFLTFQDSDDWWHPDKLDLQMRVLTDPANPSLVATGCNWRLMQPGIRLRGGDTSTNHQRFSREAILHGRLTGVINTPMLLIDTERAAQTPHFDTSFRSLEERDFLYQLLPAKGEPLAILDSVLVDVRRGRADHVANPEGTLSGYERFLSKYDAELTDYPDVRDWYHYCAMRESLILRRWALADEHRSAVHTASPLLTAEYVLGRLFGYYGLAVANRLHLRPALGRRWGS